MPETKSAARTCQSCGGSMPARMSRQRDDKGNLVCDSCKANPQPEWTTTHSALSVLDSSEMRRREAEALTSIVRVRKAKHAGRQVTAHDSGDQAVIHHCPFCGSGAVVGNSDGSASCDFCHSSFTVQVQPAHPFMPQTIDGEPVVPPGMPGGQETELSAPTDPAVEEDGEDVASDPLGDADPSQVPPPPEKAKKPSDGGGSKPPWLKNKSSRTAAPSYPYMPGVPAAGHVTSGGFWHPGAIDTCPKSPCSEEAEAKQAYRTADGRTLDAEAYMARLALEHADDRDAVLDQVRMAHTQREAAPKGDQWRKREDRGEHTPAQGLRITPDKSRPGVFLLWDGDRRLMEGTQEEVRTERDRLKKQAHTQREAISFYDGPHTDSNGVPIGVYDIVMTPDGKGEVGALAPDTEFYRGLGGTVQVEMEGSPGYAAYGDPGDVERDYRHFSPEQVTIVKRHPNNLHLSSKQAASVTCWRCKGEGDTSNGVECDVCHGTGLLDEKTSAKTAADVITCHVCQGDGRDPRDVVEPYRDCPTCRGTGEIDRDDPEFFEFREPPHEASRRTATDWGSRTEEYVCSFCPDYETAFGTDDEQEMRDHLLNAHKVSSRRHEAAMRPFEGAAEKQYGGPGEGPGWLKGGRNRCEQRDSETGLQWLQLCGGRAVYWDGEKFLCSEHLPEDVKEA